ncbi:hypothetical protein TNCV_939941 [Trichonephila clavipes]|nr:hypothetical protein TNCV_939941 [Trichonephila clavipes]
MISGGHIAIFLDKYQLCMQHHGGSILDKDTKENTGDLLKLITPYVHHTSVCVRSLGGVINKIKQDRMLPVVYCSNSTQIIYTRAIGDEPRNFEPWSSDVDDT